MVWEGGEICVIVYQRYRQRERKPGIPPTPVPPPPTWFPRDSHSDQNHISLSNSGPERSHRPAHPVAILLYIQWFSLGLLCWVSTTLSGFLWRFRMFFVWACCVLLQCFSLDFLCYFSVVLSGFTVLFYIQWFSSGFLSCFSLGLACYVVLQWFSLGLQCVFTIVLSRFTVCFYNCSLWVSCVVFIIVLSFPMLFLQLFSLGFLCCFYNSSLWVSCAVFTIFSLSCCAGYSIILLRFAVLC